MGGTEAGAHDQHGDLDDGLVHVFRSFLCPLFYKAMAISLVLQVREGLSDGRWWPVVCGQTQGSIGL